MNAVLEKGLLNFGITPSDEIANKFEKYENLLVETNKQFNLTAITETDEVNLKHFVDSISCQNLIEKGSSIVDVGTGAGFPGIPLSIVRDDISLTMIDSLGKRVNFLNTVINEIGINASAFHFRAEEAGKNAKFREKYDVATSRAVANLPVLCEYCLPFVKVGGLFLALKGRDAEAEVEKAEKAIKVLGGKLEKVHEVFWEGLEHRVVVIRKVCKTPPKYPRNAGKPSKEPII